MVDTLPSHVISDVRQNPSYALAYATDTGLLSTVTKTVNGTDYVKTLTWTGTNLTGVSVWVKS